MHDQAQPTAPAVTASDVTREALTRYLTLERVPEGVAKRLDAIGEALGNGSGPAAAQLTAELSGDLRTVAMSAEELASLLDPAVDFGAYGGRLATESVLVPEVYLAGAAAALALSSDTRRDAILGALTAALRGGTVPTADVEAMREQTEAALAEQIHVALTVLRQELAGIIDEWSAAVGQASGLGLFGVSRDQVTRATSIATGRISRLLGNDFLQALTSKLAKDVLDGHPNEATE